MRDVGRRRALESAARRLVVEKYDWSAVAGELERALMGFARVDADVPSAAAGSAAVRVPLRRAVNG
jgi:hypothetical protein